jgi:activating signal cointegrator 1
MKILTLHEPYATLVALGLKPYESRSWGTDWKGDLAIHAAKRNDAGISADVKRINGFLVAYGHEPLLDVFAFGAVLAVVRLVACRRNPPTPPGLAGKLGFFGHGRVAWELADVRPLAEPIPWKGAQGLRDAPAELVHRVVEQLVVAGAPR